MKQEVIQRSQQSYNFLLKLYPKEFQRQFGEEMKFVFSESLQDVFEQDGSKGIAVFWGRTLVDLLRSVLREHVQEKKEQESMTTNKFISPTISAILGLILFLPGALLISLLMLNIEPTFINQLIPPAPPDEPQVIGTLVALTLIVLFPAIALVLNFVHIRRTVRAGGSLLAHPLNLVLVVATFVLIATLVGGFIVDQYPCWIGVPNCD